MSVFNEALEWRDRAKQARQAAGQLTDPGAKRAMFHAAKGYERLARSAADLAERHWREGPKRVQERGTQRRYSRR